MSNYDKAKALFIEATYDNRREAVEGIVDAIGVDYVLELLATVMQEKALHIQQNCEVSGVRDPLASAWSKAGNLVAGLQSHDAIRTIG